MPTTDMGGYQQGDGSVRRERWVRAEVCGTMLQPHFIFYSGFDQVVIDDLSFFREPSMSFHYAITQVVSSAYQSHSTTMHRVL